MVARGKRVIGNDGARVCAARLELDGKGTSQQLSGLRLNPLELSAQLSCCRFATIRRNAWWRPRYAQVGRRLRQGHLRFSPLDMAIVNIGQRLLEAATLPLVGLNFAILN